MDFPDLSGTAWWYLRGGWPVFEDGTTPGDRTKPDLEAMQELVNTGAAIYTAGRVSRRGNWVPGKWTLTELGERMKAWEMS